ncbi:MAG: AAA family ATPase [Deltaproteobacteria bacterium]|nr:AAA family ATPase [Deltaproteobacteria bacterium]
MSPVLPSWADELVSLYESGAVSQFLLYGNVNDRILIPRGDDTALGSLTDFLVHMLLTPFDVILTYDVGNGIRVVKGDSLFAAWHRLERETDLPKSPRPAVEALTRYFRYTAALSALGKEAPQVACIVDAASLVVPPGEGGLSQDVNSTVLLVREWARDLQLTRHALATFLLAENVNDVHPLIATNSYAGKIRVPLPDATALEQAFHLLGPRYADTLGEFEGNVAGLAHQLAGATLASAEQLLKTTRHRRETLTRERLVRLKRAMVESEHEGLIGFIETSRTLDDIHGHETVKEWVRQDIALWKANDLRALPMGYLLCGPVGTGKTFLVECLAGEAGVPVVKLKNFRDKWVGSTEGNLEKIFRLLHALGRCIVFVDEADQALGRRDAGGGDSNVSGRVYSMIAEEMSDTDNRGKILWILASSRPDRIEVDLKRPGRIDVKIPLFPTLTPAEGFQLLRALARRLDLDLPEECFAELEGQIPELLTPGAAEALAVKVYRLSRTRSISALDALRECLGSYQLPVPAEVMEFQIGLAVREATDLDFVPRELRERMHGSRDAGPET